MAILETIAGAVLPSLANGLVNWGLNQITSGNSSATNNTSSTNSTTSSSGSSSTGYSEQQGSISGLASLLNSALGSPTGNNANSAANFNGMWAQTANDLQTKQWNTANIFNMVNNAMGNLMNAASQSSAQRYNSSEAKIERDWSRTMRQTAYQDTVEDLKKAGLNPILAASNGATAASSGASANTSAMKYTGATAASVPSAHTATMSAMYDYGNNTAQFLQNAMQTINSAKQYGFNSAASNMYSMMDQIASSSAETVNQYANETGKQLKNFNLLENKKNEGANSHGGGGGRGR